MSSFSSAQNVQRMMHARDTIDLSDSTVDMRSELSLLGARNIWSMSTTRSEPSASVMAVLMASRHGKARIFAAHAFRSECTTARSLRQTCERRIHPNVGRHMSVFPESVCLHPQGSISTKTRRTFSMTSTGRSFCTEVKTLSKASDNPLVNSQCKCS